MAAARHGALCGVWLSAPAFLGDLHNEARPARAECLDWGQRGAERMLWAANQEARPATAANTD